MVRATIFERGANSYILALILVIKPVCTRATLGQFSLSRRGKGILHVLLDVISATFASFSNMGHAFRSFSVLVSGQAHFLTRCQDLLDFEHVLRPELPMDRFGCHHSRLPLSVLSLEAAHLISSH